MDRLYSQTNIDGIKHIYLRDFFENDNLALMPCRLRIFAVTVLASAGVATRWLSSEETFVK